MDRPFKQNIPCISMPKNVCRERLKDILYNVPASTPGADVLRVFRGKASGVDSEGWKKRWVGLELLDYYEVPPEEAPGFLFQMRERTDGTILGVETFRKRLVVVDCRSRVVREVPLPAGDVSSYAPVKNGYAVLSADCRTFDVVAEDLTYLGSHPVPAALSGSGYRIMCSTADGVVVPSADGGSSFFLDEEFQIRSAVNLSDHLFKAVPGVGYEGGIVMIEVYPGNVNYGELVWLSPEGGIKSLAGGFDKPFSANVDNSRLVVCDLKGLHLLELDGLYVERHELLEWASILQPLGLSKKYGHEACFLGRDLVVKVDLGRSYVCESRRYSLSRFRVTGMY